MKREKRKKRSPGQRRWDPLLPAAPSHPDYYEKAGITVPTRGYRNQLYSVFARDHEDGSIHISFHRHDRSAIRDWRHYQAIKNEVAGPERTAIEVFPPESYLFDTANEYHLWVLPEDVQLPYLAMHPEGPHLMTDADVKEQLGADTKARQRNWQPGIPTGMGAQHG